MSSGGVGMHTGLLEVLVLPEHIGEPSRSGGGVFPWPGLMNELGWGQGRVGWQFFLCFKNLALFSSMTLSF